MTEVNNQPRIIARYPASGSIPLSEAGRRAADHAAREFSRMTGHRYRADWRDDYNDYSATGHYVFIKD